MRHIVIHTIETGWGEAESVVFGARPSWPQGAGWKPALPLTVENA